MMLERSSGGHVPLFARFAVRGNKAISFPSGIGPHHRTRDRQKPGNRYNLFEKGTL
jgi:hypothetical protein